MLYRNPVAKFSYYIKSPVDLQLFRSPEHLESVKTSLTKRYRDPSIAINISQMLQSHKTSLYELEQSNKQINFIQKKIKQQITKKEKKDKSVIEELQGKIAECKKEQKQREKFVKDLGERIEVEVLKVGNIVDGITPVSKNEDDNQVISVYESNRNKLEDSRPYSELCERAGITDLTRGQKVSGHRGYFLRGYGVKLALGLAQYAIDFLENKGYTLYQSPAIITQQTLRASCQLQSIAQDVYKLEDSAQKSSYLIATSEQTLAGYYKGQVIQKSELPIRMGGYSTCFRKEAGAHGKDIHGLFRVHQFEKVEQFVISEESKSGEQMERMIGISKQFYESLDLPYRVVNIVSGELNDAASCKYDLQAWYPSQKRYRELVSVSNCTEYQSRLLKVQYLQNNQLRYPHMLNGTLIAIQRTITCLLQNYSHQTHIEIPSVLRNYLKCDKIPLK